ncbi:RNA polymerase II-associated protein 1 [Orussus abietinus]|uniref:RNA polymerase II-associated protein 1 n=1 Tax=Orussus abietinus TaxID=222816 RepID=UPI000625C8B1|nr:RNA polymerase II-associated protein 1 [Orussus abietinus]
MDVKNTEPGGMFDAIQNVPAMPSSVILGNVIERKFDAKKYEFKMVSRLSPDIPESGFPKAFVSDNKSAEGGKSLFWQKVSRKRADVEKLNEKRNIDTKESSNIPDANEIHELSVQKLNSMSKEDILQEKAKLEASLSPDLIEFIKNRKRKQNDMKESLHFEKHTIDSEPSTCSPSHVLESHKIPKSVKDSDVKQCNTNLENMCIDSDQELNNTNNNELPKPSVEMFETAKQEGWVHMDTIEPEKLKWMQDLPTENNKDPLPEEPYNARFNFKGILLPYKDKNLTVDKGLHHHGEEPDRPGYSLQELLQLSRSSTPQQRCTAINTLANIMENTRKGWYDKALQPSLLSTLNQRNLLLLLRFSLDDTSVAVVTATLQALRAFLFSEVDEVCLDKLLASNYYSEPILLPPPTDVTDTSALKDHELAQIDTVATALRSEIVMRIRYILSEIHPPPIGVIAALDILTRLARHSQKVALDIANFPYLLETIVQNFIPLSTDKLTNQAKIDNSYGVPVAAAIRLCRVLVTYAGRVVAEKLDNMKIMHSILSYINCDTSQHGVHVRIESLRLWNILLKHKVSLDSTSGAQLTLISQLQLLLCNNNLEDASELTCEYAVALVLIAAHESPLKRFITPLLFKWSTQLASASVITRCSTILIAQTLLCADDISFMNPSWISNIKIFSNLCATSNLLSGFALPSERDPSSLPSLGVLTEGGKLQPVVSPMSCIPFLSTVLSVYSKSLCKTELRRIFSVPDFIGYLRRLERTQWCLEKSWFTRIELGLLTAIVECGILLGDDLDDALKQLIWKLAIKLVAALPADAPQDVRQMLGVALPIEKFKIGILSNVLSRLNLDVEEGIIELDLPYNLVAYYEVYVSINGSWNQAAMPKDWLYLPLINLHAKCKEGYECNENDRKVISTLLSLELTLPELNQGLSPNLRFSRLLLVYLCDTLFLYKNVSALLSQAISDLVKKHYEEIDFTVEVPGLSSFTDLYTALCEHFCGVSYGDSGFAAALLVPIAQRHDVHYRKLLWSEHAGALRSLRLPSDKLIVPLKEYLFPLEEDTSLINSYMTALVRGTIQKEWSPIPFLIALHHSAMYLKRTDALAIKMRTQVERLNNPKLVEQLLHYVQPEL